MQNPKILVTGAAGKVAKMIRPLLLKKFRNVRLSDIEQIIDLQVGETFMICELSNRESVEAVTEGMDVIIHLGGISTEDSWKELLDANVLGTINIFESARKCGVSRIIYASSNHVVGFYERTDLIDVNRYLRPDSRYGVTKAFGESLASLFSDKYGIRTLCLRIGNVDFRPIDRRRLSIWIHPDDLFQLICIGIEHSSVRFEILYGVSDNVRSWYKDSQAPALGYVPRHRSEDYAEEILSQPPDVDPIAEIFQGGHFCSHEFRPPNADPIANAFQGDYFCSRKFREHESIDSSPP